MKTLTESMIPRDYIKLDWEECNKYEKRIEKLETDLATLKTQIQKVYPNQDEIIRAVKNDKIQQLQALKAKHLKKPQTTMKRNGNLTHLPRTPPNLKLQK